MGKGKLRHNPDKEQNKRGGKCEHYEGTWCHLPFNEGFDVKICKGNPHNCVKIKYKKLAIKRIDK